MLASIALVGCTNDDVLENPNVNPENEGKSTSYVSVKLLMAESNRGRAATDGGYAQDSERAIEQTINTEKTIFLFYDGAGNFVTFGSLVDSYSLDNNEEGTHHENKDINSIYGDKFIALSATEDAVKNIDQVLTVANYYNIGLLKNKPLSEVLKMVADDALNKADARGEGENFLMTTSVYHDGTNWVETTAISDENICATQSEAYNKAVKIYIERAAAKVELVSGNEDKSWTFAVAPTSEDKKEDPNTEADVVVDGVLTAAKVQILGWTLNNYNLETNLVKRYDKSWATTEPFNGWNNSADHRSYWAMDNDYKYNGSPTTTTLADHQAVLTTKSFNNAIRISDNGDDKNRINVFDIMYCYEHAKALSEDNVAEGRESAVEFPNVTTVLIAGRVLLDESTNAVTLYKYNGVYFREAAYKSMVASFLRKYQKTVENGTAIMEEADWTIELAKKAEGKDFTFGITIGLAEGIKLANEADIAAINGEIADMYVSSTDEETGETTIHTEVLTDGYCYYQIPIEHLTSVTNAPLYGVIRNHWYQLKINAVAHIGEPVGDPDKPLPEIPTKETAYYLAAELHVLNWHVVQQDVTLE